jgi:isopentenyl-diphosphate delta-isomerase
MLLKSKYLILKLGGSFLTNKEEPFSLRKDIIKNSVEQIIKSKRNMILVHGGGSFGHPVAKKYNIVEGNKKKVQNQIYGLAKTHNAMVKLNSYLTDLFLENNFPALSIQTSSIFFKDGNKMTFNPEVVNRCVKLDILPILYGDIIFSKNGDFSIISGDTIILELCKKMKDIEIEKVVFTMETDGIYVYDKNSETNKVATSLKCSELGDLSLARLGNKIDVTGGIRGKIKQIKKICDLGIPVQLINGLKEDFLLKSLLNKDVPGTFVNVSSDKASSVISNRKIEHLKIPIRYDVQHKENYLDYMELLHNPLPEYDLNEIDLTCNFFNKQISAPICIAAITGGHPIAKKINGILAEAAQKERIILSVGSQRAGLTNPSLKETFSIVRNAAPDIPIIGNIGIGQISSPDFNLNDFGECIEMIGADVMAVHLNALHERAQGGEGDTSYKLFYENFRKIREAYDIPIIAKEVGSGFNVEAARKLDEVRVDGFDIGGRGGTSFAAIESYRNTKSEKYTRNLADIYREWGIPTPVSICNVRKITEKPIIATGGLRSGEDIAKCMALGANYAGFAFKFLKTAWKDYKDKMIKNTIKEIKTLKNELRSCLWLMNFNKATDLIGQKENLVLFGKLFRWLNQ